METGIKKKYTSFVRERSVFVYFVRSDGNLWLVPCDVDCGHSASNLTLQFSISQILERSINLFIWYLQKEPITSSVLLRETWSGPLRPTIPPGSASRDSVAPEAGGSKGDVLFYPLQAQNSCGSGWLHQSCIGHIGRLYFPWPKCPLSGALPGQTAHCFERYERVGARLYVTVLHLSLCSSKAHFTTKTNVQIHKCFFHREEKNRDLNGIALKPKFGL